MKSRLARHMTETVSVTAGLFGRGDGAGCAGVNESRLAQEQVAEPALAVRTAWRLTTARLACGTCNASHSTLAD